MWQKIGLWCVLSAACWAHAGQPAEIEKALHGNKIVLPRAYTYEVLKNGSVSDIQRAARGGADKNTYRSNSANAGIVINDLNHLPKDVRVELSLFVAGLLNPLREKFGVGQYVVSEGGLDFAQAVADEYQEHNQSIWNRKGHFVEGITRAAARFGLNDENNYYENIGGRWSSTDTGVMSLDELKSRVYESIVSMLFQDEQSGQGHAKSLLAAGQYDEQNRAAAYLGVDTSVPSDSTKFSIHFIAVTDERNYIKDPEKFMKTFDKKPLVAP